MKYYCVWADYDQEKIEVFSEEKELKSFLIELLNNDDSYGKHLIGVFYGSLLIVRETARKFIADIDLIKK